MLSASPAPAERFDAAGRLILKTRSAQAIGAVVRGSRIRSAQAVTDTLLRGNSALSTLGVFGAVVRGSRIRSAQAVDAVVRGSRIRTPQWVCHLSRLHPGLELLIGKQVQFSCCLAQR